MFDKLFPERFARDQLGIYIDRDLALDQKITDFYDIAPFPNYEESESIASLLRKGDQNDFMSQISRLLKPGDKFLEAGCGTGQVTNYLAASSYADVYGTDLTYASLKLGAEYRNINSLKNAHFIRHNILQSPLPKDYFDYVWCSGVLHHTPDPYGGYVRLLDSLKPGGLIFIGLYNRYTRFRTVLRQKLYSTGSIGRLLVRNLDPVLRKNRLNVEKFNSWERDQYIHPRESLHTLAEVKQWFYSNDVEYVSSVPRLDFNQLEQPHFLQIEKERSSLFGVAAQMALLLESVGSEGGLIVNVGRKKGN